MMKRLVKVKKFGGVTKGMESINSFLDLLDVSTIEIPDKIIEIINKSTNIAVIGHIEPDGDAVSSQLALVEALTSLGKSADAINVGPFDKYYAKTHKKKFLKTIIKKYDLYIIVDTPGTDRIGRIAEDIDLNKAIVIDHHVTNTGYGSINWIDENFISTSEMIFLLLLKMGINFSGTNICQILLNGIISDNGYFLHIRQNKYFSLLVSFILIDNGADPKKSYHILFGGKDVNSKKLLALALQRIEQLSDNQILYTYLSEEDRNKYGRTGIDSAAIFKEMMSIKGVKIAILFKIMKNRIDISLRADEMTDVAKLAKDFGGGGHKAAAGFTAYEDFEVIKERLLAEALKIVS